LINKFRDESEGGVMTESQRKIQEKIRQIKRESINPIEDLKPVKSSPKVMPIFMGCCIVLLTIATIGLMVNKKSNTQQITKNNQSSNFVIPVDSDKIIVNNRLDNLESEVKTWRHRAWLLSIAVNENANLAKKQHNAGYITFNDEWRLSHAPTTMSLSEETKAKLVK